MIAVLAISGCAIVSRLTAGRLTAGLAIADHPIAGRAIAIHVIVFRWMPFLAVAVCGVY